MTALLCTLLAACYEPDAVDCTVECGGPGECAHGQVCGSDGYCAAPDVAGECRTVTDEPRQISLVIAIAGHGKVTIEDVGNCDTESPTGGNCTFLVTAGAVQELDAVEANEREFIAWTSTCSGTAARCTLAPVMALTQVGATFE